MKRKGNVYEGIYTIENLREAEKIARRGKKKQYGVKLFDKDPEGNLLKLQEMLANKTYRTSPYSIRTIYDPKEREIYCLPYFPDRIAQHAAMLKIKPDLIAAFTADSYSCIEGKGIHGFDKNLKKVLKKDVPGTKYCLKIDVKKFYPSISHPILKRQIRRKWKDPDLLNFLDEIINSAPGVPIGNYVSQFFANFYLTGFDHWLKENKRVKYYFRYADDIVILASNKPELHQLLADMRVYLDEHLKLTIKSNYQIFPVAKRGIDVCGYVYFHTHVMLRKKIKQNFARMLKKRKNDKSIAAYKGWAVHGNCKHLLKKILPDDKRFWTTRHNNRREKFHGTKLNEKRDTKQENKSACI